MSKTNQDKEKFKTEFKRGTLVWAKIMGFRWWPATIVKVSRDGQTYNVKFIGEDSYSDLPINKIADFQEKYENYTKLKRQNKKFKAALEEANKLLETIKKNAEKATKKSNKKKTTKSGANVEEKPEATTERKTKVNKEISQTPVKPENTVTKATKKPQQEDIKVKKKGKPASRKRSVPESSSAKDAQEENSYRFESKYLKYLLRKANSPEDISKKEIVIKDSLNTFMNTLSLDLIKENSLGENIRCLSKLCNKHNVLETLREDVNKTYKQMKEYVMSEYFGRNKASLLFEKISQHDTHKNKLEEDRKSEKLNKKSEEDALNKEDNKHEKSSEIKVGFRIYEN